MIIQNTSVTVTYNRIEGIKKSYFINEEKLKEFFNEATVLPVPDDAPVEIPRIIAKTKNEHAQLNISPVATTFEVTYNDGFEKNWEKCADYIRKRMTKVFEFLNLLTENNYEYIGLVSTIVIDEYKERCVERLSKVLLNTEKIGSLYDINIRYTFVEEKDKFVNITLQNARLYGNANANIAGALSIKNQLSESIGAIVDVNDRYAFNTVENYKSSSTNLDSLLYTMGKVISEKLNSLITKGEY